MNLAADMGDMFIVPDVTLRASLPIIDIGDTGLGRQTGYRSPEFRGRLTASASLFTFIHGHACFDCLKTVIRNEVVTERIIWDTNPISKC